MEVDGQGKGLVLFLPVKNTNSKALLPDRVKLKLPSILTGLSWEAGEEPRGRGWCSFPLLVQFFPPSKGVVEMASVFVALKT